MGDFSQNGIISNLHDFGTKSTADIEKELLKFSKERKMELILPSLYSELKGDALSNIVKQIGETKYLNHIIIGLDKATKSEAIKAWKFFKRLNTPFTILWNDGPKLKKLHEELKEKGLAPSETGKGRNVWYCYGYILASGRSEAIALHDCDILTYDRSLLARLIYPVANPNFSYAFCKGYYSRIAGNKISGRVMRLFVTPLIRSLKKVCGNSEFLDYTPRPLLLKEIMVANLTNPNSFRYPLAGEFSMRAFVINDLRIPSDWGLEIGVLSEMKRNYATNRLSQTDIADIYDHKHQDLSLNDQEKGLSRKKIRGEKKPAQKSNYKIYNN